MSKSFRNTALVLLLLVGSFALAQQPTTGILEGVVVDRDGAPLPGATVVLIGPFGEQGAQSNQDGVFEYRFLTPGKYRVRCSLADYGTVEIPDIEVVTGQRTRVPITLMPGRTEEITVSSAAPLVDPKRVEVVSNFKSAQTIETLPVGRNFVDALALAPGVVSGGATGEGNYSIGGSSGLENSYLIDGVNITDSGYGGVGTYSINYGSLGTGITTDFLEEVQVKTAGFEAEFGQALGGVISGTVKSGSNTFSGSVRAYFTPASLEGGRALADLPTGAVNIVEEDEVDLGLSAGGPILKDRLFWFAAYNPVSSSFLQTIQPTTNPLLDLNDPGVDTNGDGTVDTFVSDTYPVNNFFSNANSELETDRDRDNYAVKFNFLASANHRFELTAFGDPSDGVGSDGIRTGQFFMEGDSNGDGTYSPAEGLSSTSLGALDDQGASTIDYGADQQSLRYNGFFGSDWFVEAQASHRENDFEETSNVNAFRYLDERVTREWSIAPLLGLDPAINRASSPRGGGSGFVGPTLDETWDYSIKISKIWGNHEVKAGFQFFDIEYSQISRYSGPSTTLNFPDGEGGFIPLETTSGVLVNVRGGIPGCSLCVFSTGQPYYQITRSRFNEPGPVTGEEMSLFIQDTWTINDQWVLKVGIRTTQQELSGSSAYTLPISREGARDFSPEPTTFTPNSYEFDTELSPRIGVTFDPFANGKTKLYAHYARLFERVPADLAVRQFSNEFGTTSFQFTDPRLTNWRGTSISVQGLSPGRVEDDTKLPYVDEYVIGFQQQLRPDLALEMRGIYRDQGRVLEDVQFTTLEAIQNYYYSGLEYYFDNDGDGTPEGTGVTPEPFPGFGQGAFGEYVLANPGENTEGPFGTPVREYKAFEIEVTKRLADNWQFIANYRYAKLQGNYEGLFRNDNTQSDPNITSLFDFPNSPLMRGQYAEGPLNTDRPHVMNLLGTYFFDNGLEIGGALKWQSGTPRTPLLAHPSYLNAGEIPGVDPIYYQPGGDPDLDGTLDWVGVPGSGLFLADYTDSPRGSLGRLPDLATIDLHLGYQRKFGDTRLKITADVLNIFNIQEATAISDDVESIAQTPNPNFNRITDYQIPRTIRLAAIWDW